MSDEAEAAFLDDLAQTEGAMTPAAQAIHYWACALRGEDLRSADRWRAEAMALFERADHLTQALVRRHTETAEERSTRLPQGCTFCGRTRHETQWIVADPVTICDRCVTNADASLHLGPGSEAPPPDVFYFETDPNTHCDWCERDAAWSSGMVARRHLHICGDCILSLRERLWRERRTPSRQPR